MLHLLSVLLAVRIVNSFPQINLNLSPLGALGVRIKATSEERENERRVLKEARERKLLAAKKNQEREDSWNN